MARLMTVLRRLVRVSTRRRLIIPVRAIGLLVLLGGYVLLLLRRRCSSHRIPGSDRRRGSGVVCGMTGRRCRIPSLVKRRRRQRCWDTLLPPTAGGNGRCRGLHRHAIHEFSQSLLFLIRTLALLLFDILQQLSTLTPPIVDKSLNIFLQTRHRLSHLRIKALGTKKPGV